MIEWKVIGLMPEMLQSIYDAIGECFQYIKKRDCGKTQPLYLISDLEKPSHKRLL